MTLILGSFKPEVEPALEEMEVLERGRVVKRYYQRGLIGRNEVVVTFGFIGKVEASLVTQAFLDRFKIDRVFLTGVAGALVDSVHVGDVVVGDSYVEHDFETMMGDTGITLAGSLELLEKLNRYFDAKPLVGKIASGDAFVSDFAKRRELSKRIGAICFDLDSAAVAKVCQENDREFLSLKVIIESLEGCTEEELRMHYEKHSFLANLLLVNAMKSLVF